MKYRWWDIASRDIAEATFTPWGFENFPCMSDLSSKRFHKFSVDKIMGQGWTRRLRAWDRME